MKAFVLVIILLFACPLAGYSEYYKYRDENGVLRFSDTLPEKYADQAATYQESSSRKLPAPKIGDSDKDAVPQAQRPARQPRPARAETKFRLHKNRILIPVKIIGTRGSATLQLVMDTGAQRTFLWRPATPSIGLTRVGRVRAAGITGSKYASFVKVKSLNIGPYELRNAVVAIMNPGRHNTDYDGLLGMDFLMQAKYEIDYDRNVIVWKGLN